MSRQFLRRRNTVTDSRAPYKPQTNTNKKLSCRRETALRFVSLNILLGHSRSLKVTRNDTVEYGVC